MYRNLLYISPVIWVMGLDVPVKLTWGSGQITPSRSEQSSNVWLMIWIPYALIYKLIEVFKFDSTEASENENVTEPFER